MQPYESLKHTTWECKYHVVFIPKYRRKALYAQLRRDLGSVFRGLAEQKESKVEDGKRILSKIYNEVAVHFVRGDVAPSRNLTVNKRPR